MPYCAAICTDTGGAPTALMTRLNAPTVVFAITVGVVATPLAAVVTVTVVVVGEPFVGPANAAPGVPKGRANVTGTPAMLLARPSVTVADIVPMLDPAGAATKLGVGVRMTGPVTGVLALSLTRVPERSSSSAVTSS